MIKYQYRCKDCVHFGEHAIKDGERKVGCDIIDCDHAYPISANRDCTMMRCSAYVVAANSTEGRHV